ncbi:hypothetical protein [Caminibacter sp.]
MKVNSIVHKYINKLSLYMKTKNRYKNTYFFHNKKQVNKVLFYFPKYELMHLGDHIFFEPVIRELSKIGYDVYVKPVKLMESYFTINNHKLYKDDDFNDIDLIISRVEFFYDLKKYLNSKNVILFDTADNKIDTPLCLDIIKKTFIHMNIEFDSIDDRPSVLKDFSFGLDIDDNDKYILFNNYVDSSRFRINKKMLQDMEKKVIELKTLTNVKVIHTGSKNDKIKDKKNYHFVDLDLRGETTVEDIFYLLSKENVIYNVSFDAFQMHVAFLYNKKSFVKFRGRVFKKNADFIINYVNPPFTVKNKNDLIEYI